MPPKPYFWRGVVTDSGVWAAEFPVPLIMLFTISASIIFVKAVLNLT
jgi:hypothetical protein